MNDSITKKSVEQFKNYFKDLTDNTREPLNNIYTKNVIFEDPIKKITGIENLEKHFKKMDANVVNGGFTVTNEIHNGNQVALQWVFECQLKRPRQKVRCVGSTFLEIDGKIVKHTDHFDLGALVYEHLPLIGGMIRFVKSKM